MVTKKLKPEPEDGYDSMVMPDSYFATALLCCDVLINSKNSLTPTERTISDSSAFTDFHSRHNNRELIRPLIFNLKQGIELYIKGLSGLYLDEYKQSHDLRELFEHVIQVSKRHTTEHYEFFVSLHRKTWPIIEKYYYGLYIPTHTDYAHPDKMNISERYPRGGEGYDLGEYYKWVTIEKIGEIKKDILSLQNYFAEAKKRIDKFEDI